MSATYDLQAQRIESVFGAYKVPARVWQATVTPRFVRFDVTVALGTRLAALERLDDEIAMALGVRNVRIYRDGGVIHVEAPRETPRRLGLATLAERVKPCPAACAMLGIDEQGTPLLLRLASPDVAHVLVAGTTGSGKTALLRTMIASLAMHNRVGFLQFVVIDPKGYSLAAFAELPHVRVLAISAQESAAALAWLVAEMERRPREALPRLVLVIDELAEVVMADGNAVAALTRLTQRGREANIHVVAATQRPSAALVGGMVKANFPVRVIGSVTSADDARVAAGMAGTGAERLLGRGDFLLVAKGQTLRFQAAYADEDELRRIVDGIGRVATERRPPLQIEAGGVGSGVGIEAPVGLFVGVDGRVGAHPTPPHPAKRPLRERYTLAELRGFLDAAGGRLKEATEAAFGYSDRTTLMIMREAAQEGADDE